MNRNGTYNHERNNRLNHLAKNLHLTSLISRHRRVVIDMLYQKLANTTRVNSMVMESMGSSGLELLPHARGLKMLAPWGPVYNEFEVGGFFERGVKEGYTHDDTKYECSTIRRYWDGA
jgi:hypothetical protein